MRKFNNLMYSLVLHFIHPNNNPNQSNKLKQNLRYVTSLIWHMMLSNSLTHLENVSVFFFLLFCLDELILVEQNT